jgi:tetratricopeptide (TPR) repeat protein
LLFQLANSPAVGGEPGADKHGPETRVDLPAHAGTSPSPAAVADRLASDNLLQDATSDRASTKVKDLQHQIEMVRTLRRQKDNDAAAKMLIDLLENEIPPEFKRAALFELALVAQDQKQLPRAQQILAQYIKLFPQDPSVPEIILRQGLIFRQMGAYSMAIGKYYSVMNSALTIKLDQFEYYKRVVLQAQTEIAETYYLQGKYAEAAEFFTRLLKLDASDLNRVQIQFKLIRCLAGLGKHTEVVTRCQTFFEKYPDAPEVPELRFTCASSLKQLGRNTDALAQVVRLLESQEKTADTNPENWAFWQQRAGNEIANALYQEGDYLSALEIYSHLAELSNLPSWQLPAWYQIGIIYERLRQPKKATEKYDAILARDKDLVGEESTPSLKTVVEMAKWRKEQLSWQGRAEVAVQSLRLNPVRLPSTNSTSSNTP